MSPEVVGIIGVVIMVALIFLRVWVGVAMITVGVLGFILLEGWRHAFIIAGTEPYSQISVYVISCVPLFILMGIVASETGIAGDLYNAANNNIPGGLAIATTVATGGFAAVCGSSDATAAAMGKVAFPEMKKLGYDSKLAACPFSKQDRTFIHIHNTVRQIISNTSVFNGMFRKLDTDPGYGRNPETWWDIDLSPYGL